MDAAPFLVPLIGSAIVISTCWGACLCRRVGSAEARIRLLERQVADQKDAVATADAKASVVQPYIGGYSFSTVPAPTPPFKMQAQPAQPPPSAPALQQYLQYQSPYY